MLRAICTKCLRMLVAVRDVWAVTVASQLSVWHVCTVQCGAVV